MQQRYKSGFTIIELLIVIIIIAILAAITIVAYNGVQGNARLSVMREDISTINEAINRYYVEHGTYPFGSPATGAAITAGPGVALNIPGLIPDYLPRVPEIPDAGRGNIDYYAYIWGANGSNYKLVRLVSSASYLPANEQSIPTDPVRPGRGWGYWSANGASL